LFIDLKGEWRKMVTFGHVDIKTCAMVFLT